MSAPGPLSEYLMPLRTVASTFARLDTQREMLGDRARVEALHRAIQAVVQPGDVVVEIGTGTGLLAAFAVRAGARKVYAIEATELAGLAREVLAANGLGEQVEVLQGFSTDLELPERGDVLITETLGHLGVDEGIVTTVADARARLLKPDARLIPESIDIFLGLTRDDGVAERELSFWAEEVAGLDMRAVLPHAAGRVYLRGLTESELLATPKRIAHIDLHRDDQAPRSFEALFYGKAEAEIRGLAAWFETELGGGVRLASRATSSWFPLFFPVDPALPIAPLQAVGVTLEARDQGDEVAWSWQLEGEGDLGSRQCGR